MVAMCCSFRSFIIPSRRLRQACQNHSSERVTQNANRWYLNSWELPKLYTDSASSYRALTGYEHESVNHTKKEYARGDVHENRAECLFSLLKPYLRVFRGVSKFNLPGYVGFFQFLRNFRQQNAFEQAELILRAALDPTMT